MKFWIMLFSAALFAGGTCLGVALRPTIVPAAAPAAPPPAPERDWGWGGWRGEISVTRFANELGLSEEQDAELDRILGDTQRDSEAYGRAMRAAHERARERVTELLSAEQKTKLDDLLADERRRRSEGETQKQADAYARLLKLAPEAKAELAKIFADTRARRHAFFSDEKRKDRENYRSFFRGLKEEQHAKVKALLAPEQYETYLAAQDLTERDR